MMLRVAVIVGVLLGGVAVQAQESDVQAQLKAEQAKSAASEQRVKALEEKVASLAQRVPPATAEDQAIKRKQSHKDMCAAVGRKVDRVHIDLTSGTVTLVCK